MGVFSFCNICGRRIPHLRRRCIFLFYSSLCPFRRLGHMEENQNDLIQWRKRGTLHPYLLYSERMRVFCCWMDQTLVLFCCCYYCFFFGSFPLVVLFAFSILNAPPPHNRVAHRLACQYNDEQRGVPYCHPMNPHSLEFVMVI